MSGNLKLIAVLVAMAWFTTNSLGQNEAKRSGIEPSLLAKANAGNPDAEFRVGVEFELGGHVPKDPAKAAEWYRKAADQGDVKGEHSLGVLYESGTGVPLDYARAAELYRKAAEKGFAPAEFSLGVCYAHGQGVPQSFEHALEWYRKAAEQNNTDALLNLAFLYQNGQGVPKDPAQSFAFVRMAAEAGSADAQFQLGMDYNNGEHGLQTNYDLAASWLRRSAKQGHVAAQFNLAMLLKAEPAEVYYWLSLATPHLLGKTRDKSAELRQAAAARLRPADRAQIDQRVKSWHPVEEQL